MRTVVSTRTVRFAIISANDETGLTDFFAVSNPSHIELILTEGEEVVQKAPQAVHREQGLHHLTSRQRGQRRKAITQGS